MSLRSKNPAASSFYRLETLAFSIIISIFIISFSSCSDDNPVKTKQSTNEIKDSSIFDWQFVECTPYTMNDIFVADTNKFFFASLPDFIVYDGKNIAIISGVAQYYVPQVVRGSDESNVFFAGKYSTGQGKFMPWLKKWNGSSMEDILLPQDSVTNGIMDMYVNSANDVWISVYPARFYHYDGSITTYASANPNIYLSFFFKDKNGVFYCNGITPIRTHVWLFQSMRWENNSWNTYSSDTVIDNITPMQGATFTCGVDLLRGGANSLFYFDNQSWFNLTSTEFYVGCVGGYSKSSFLCSALFNNTFPFYMLYFNGSKWYLQNSFTPPNYFYYNEIVRIKLFKNNYYGFFNNTEITNYFFIGRPKQ